MGRLVFAYPSAARCMHAVKIEGITWSFRCRRLGSFDMIDRDASVAARPPRARRSSHALTAEASMCLKPSCGEGGGGGHAR